MRRDHLGEAVEAVHGLDVLSARQLRAPREGGEQQPDSGQASERRIAELEGEESGVRRRLFAREAAERQEGGVAHEPRRVLVLVVARNT